MSRTFPEIFGPRKSKSVSLRISISGVELVVVTIDSPLVERDAPFRGEIRLDARPFRHALAQRDKARHFLLKTLHTLRESVAQAFDDLEQRQVDITQPAADHVFAAVVP